MRPDTLPQVLPLNIDEVQQKLYKRALNDEYNNLAGKCGILPWQYQNWWWEIGFTLSIGNTQHFVAFCRSIISRRALSNSRRLVRDKQIKYKPRDLQGNQLPCGYYYPELSKTISTKVFYFLRDSSTTVYEFSGHRESELLLN